MSSLIAGERTMMSDFLDGDAMGGAVAVQGNTRLSSGAFGDDFDF